MPSLIPDRMDDTGRDPRSAAQAAALETILRSCYDDLYLTVYRYVRSRALAEDVIQDVLLALWQRRSRWGGGDLVDLKSYLFVASRNRAVSLLRRQRVEDTWRGGVALGRHETGLSRFTAAAGAESDADPVLVARLERAMAELPARARETIMLRVRRQLTNAEIAEVMGITVKAVERNITRALEALRGALGPWVS